MAAPAQWLLDSNSAASIPGVSEVQADPAETERAAVDREVEAVVRAARVFSAVTAESIAQGGDSITLPQLRVLTLASTVDSLSNSQVAAALGVHISNASRICERLVQGGLLARRDSPRDRRQVELTITEHGTEVIGTVTNHRRSVFRHLLEQMSAPQRAALGEALSDFTGIAELALRSPHTYLP